MLREPDNVSYDIGRVGHLTRIRDPKTTRTSEREQIHGPRVRKEIQHLVIAFSDRSVACETRDIDKANERTGAATLKNNRWRADNVCVGRCQDGVVIRPAATL
ncbi:hypothetical protein J6590_047617 [Homalodisca vitripennis]|nr:hypothetical protein J6590_047617 [Homalodisca vitripennis]